MFKTVFIFFLYFPFILKMDTCEIIKHCLKEFFMQENYNLNKLIAYYQNLTRRLQQQIMQLTTQINARNQRIATLQQQIGIRFRIPVRINGEIYVFERAHDGIYQIIDEDETDTDEEMFGNEEEIQNIARRLGFESESEYESDNTIDLLMGD